MNNQNIEQKNSLKEEVFKKIKEGEVSMKPRAYFVFKVILLVLVVVVSFITSAILISYILFSIKTGGQLFLLGFGPRGFFEFLLVFPWLVLVINLLLLLFIDWLLKSFRFGYNSPIIYLFMGTLAVITFFGFLINFTSLHGKLLHRAEEKQLPFMGGFYQDLRKSHEENGMFRGEVVAIEGNTFLLSRPGTASTTKVIAPINADIANTLHVGEEVFVAGDLVNSEIHAFGVHKIDKSQ